MGIFLVALTGLYGYIIWKLIFYQRFTFQRSQVDCRVHVNGIRGKSTVTRYVSAVFREAGYHTFGKTTGTAARILRPDGSDLDFKRKGYPNVNEQIQILNHFFRQKAEVIVMECMAVNPIYAQWLEEKVMDSHINIITNIRYDHPEYLGETLPEIARSLSVTIPRNGIVLTVESEPRLLKILWEEAQQKNSQFILADVGQVADEDLQGFTHFAHKENVAIGYEIAKLINLPLDRALKAMQTCVSDPGAFQIQYISLHEKNIAWANLFAINDRESFVDVCEKLFEKLPDYATIVILNNRLDRPTRVGFFAELAIALNFDRIVTFGDYESEVKQICATSLEKLIFLGNSSPFKDFDGKVLLGKMLETLDNPHVLLVGAVNIHTHQAETLLEFFASQSNLNNIQERSDES
ncbi:MAG: poly-gamma-glutamate synthase PgsB [Merismopediaceae bacterium]|nr:poly-gamma-glutamate synthase PgsB [Merismopediaceae bacterium]